MTIDEADAYALVIESGKLHRYVGDAVIFDDLSQAQHATEDLILAIPFRQALHRGRPISGPELGSRQHVSAIQIRQHHELDLDTFLRSGSAAVPLIGGQFDEDDHDYAERVNAVLDREIRTGHGSNFVLHRTFRGRIPVRDEAAELSLLRELARRAAGAYWTFLVHFPDHSLVGASPEMHLRRSVDGRTTMNPISGTYRYPAGGPDESSLRAFLGNPKEQNELWMVVDEELKIMTDLCDDRPWLSEPQLKFMTNLAHTEYFIHGTSSIPWSEALCNSLVAPTVIGSPLESAFRMAQRNDVSPRSYLGGVLAHVSHKGGTGFDSAILIRTACIDADGEVSIPIGSTIVRDSVPLLEAAETVVKASGMLAAFAQDRPVDLRSVATELLDERARRVADFWVRKDNLVTPLLPRPLRALIVDFDDRFTGMLSAHLESMGLDVRVCVGRPSDQQLHDTELLVLGPGPGDPNDCGDPRIAVARELAAWAVETRRIPTLAVCLSHQLVCRALGFPIERLPRSNQGIQRTIAYFGEQVRVGFYNSFSAYVDEVSRPVVDVAHDIATGEIHGVWAYNLASMQFHPESILSVDGASVLRQAVIHLLAQESPAA